MQSNFGRVALGAAAVLAAVVLLIVLQDGGGGDEGGGTTTTAAERTGRQSGGKERQPSEPTIPTIAVKDGKPVGGVRELTYEAGERIRFAVESNVRDEVHIHGYDVAKELRPGGSVEFEFPATIEGIFEAELHGSGEQIAELRIEP